MPLEKISYDDLLARQKENYNFQKLAAKLADYGFNTIRLSDDWQGADCLAVHIDGKQFLKIQLKGRFTIDKKYSGKQLWVAFPHGHVWYLFQHDKVVSDLKKISNYQTRSSWKNGGKISTGRPGPKLLRLLNKYRIE